MSAPSQRSSIRPPMPMALVAASALPAIPVQTIDPVYRAQLIEEFKRFLDEVKVVKNVPSKKPIDEQVVLVDYNLIEREYADVRPVVGGDPRTGIELFQEARKFDPRYRDFVDSEDVVMHSRVVPAILSQLSGYNLTTIVLGPGSTNALEDRDLKIVRALNSPLSFVLDIEPSIASEAKQFLEMKMKPGNPNYVAHDHGGKDFMKGFPSDLRQYQPSVGIMSGGTMGQMDIPYFLKSYNEATNEKGLLIFSLNDNPDNPQHIYNSGENFADFKRYLWKLMATCSNQPSEFNLEAPHYSARKQKNGDGTYDVLHTHLFQSSTSISFGKDTYKIPAGALAVTGKSKRPSGAIISEFIEQAGMELAKSWDDVHLQCMPVYNRVYAAMGKNFPYSFGNLLR